jgi:hypothetical protein
MVGPRLERSGRWDFWVSASILVLLCRLRLSIRAERGGPQFSIPSHCAIQLFTPQVTGESRIALATLKSRPAWRFYNGSVPLRFQSCWPLPADHLFGAAAGGASLVINAWKRGSERIGSQSGCQHRYDAVVILAHSQGCVITADVLRFLHDVATTETQDMQASLMRDKELDVFFPLKNAPALLPVHL